MATKLTDLVKEAMAKSETAAGRLELAEQRERMDAEARQAAQVAENGVQKAADAEIEPQRAPESAPSDSPRGRGRVDSASNASGPRRIEAETRSDPILPVVRSVREHPAREAGRLAFGGIIEKVGPLPAQLPLLPAPSGPRVPLLELVDRYGVPTMLQGRGAPLELAVYIGALLLTPHQERRNYTEVVTTVREVRDFLFGGTWRPGPTGNRAGDWARVREAALNTSGLWLPLEDGDLWRGVVVRKIPPADYRPEYLDREILFDTRFPSAGDGPVIDKLALSRLRRVSGPKFRAYVAAHSVAWRPGVTRRPHPRNRRFHMWSVNPENYPVLTREDRRRLAYGVADKKHRTRGEQDAAWEDLPGVEILTRTASTADGRRGWLVVPDEAAAALRKRGSRDD